jgi:hypothetical protein
MTPVKSRKISVASLILGLLSCVLSFISCLLPVIGQVLPIILGILAVILGSIGIAASSEKRGIAIAGLLTGLAGTILNLLFLLVWGIGIAALVSIFSR